MAITICVTGHIDLKDPKKVKNEIDYFLRYLKKNNPNTDIIALSSMAAGADTIFAHAVIDAKIPLKIVLPFQIEDYQKDFKKEDWEDTNKIISQNDYQVNETIAYENRESRNNAYLNTGKRLVDQSDIILAIWDGKEATGVGGTGDIVKYSQQNKQKELHIISAVRNKNYNQDEPRNRAQDLFDTFDKEAVNTKKFRFTLIWRAGISIGLLGVLVFFYNILINKDLHFAFILSCIEFISILLSVFLINVITNIGKVKFLTLRRDAEYLRSILTFSDSGIVIPTINIMGYKPTTEVLALESEIKIQSKLTNNFPNSKRSIWSLIVQQIEYQTLKRKVRVEKELSYLTKALKLLKWGFFSLFVVNFALEVDHHFHFHFFEKLKPIFSLIVSKIENIEYETSKPYIYFVLSIIPPIYAAIEGFKFFGEYNKDLKIIDETVKKLKKMEETVINCPDSNSLTDISIELRKILEKENIDWAIRLKEKHIEKGA